jgi:hypothetical protein
MNSNTHLEVLTEEAKKIFPVFSKFQGFYLAGGTGLALQIGHRVSVDFDFFCDTEIPKTLLQKTKRAFDGFNVIARINNPDELTISVNGVKVTFLKYPFKRLFDPVLYNGIELLSPKEIAITKAYTIGRRGEYKDYADLFFCLKKNVATLEEIIKFAEQKYGEDFNSRIFLEQLVYFEDIEVKEIVFLAEKVSISELKVFFEEEVKKIQL